MKALLIVFFMLTVLVHTGCQPKVTTTDTEPPSHQLFDELLKKHVDAEGLVDYRGLATERARLKSYLDLLTKSAPNDQWTEDEKLAYWINAYNAFTLELILEYYPVKSIKDIGAKIQIPFVNTPWDIKFIEIGGQSLDLNNIEHSIIRKQFDDPRIHFALVCAAVSCPRLRNEAFVPEKLDEQLTAAARDFLSTPSKNDIKSPQEAELSKIFSWYGGDFKKKGTLIEYLNQYAPLKLNPTARITFKDYDWALNEQPQ